METQRYTPTALSSGSIYVPVQKSTPLSIDWGPFFADLKVSVDGGPLVSTSATNTSRIARAVVRLDYSGKEAIPLIVLADRGAIGTIGPRPAGLGGYGDLIIEGKGIPWVVKDPKTATDEPNILEITDAWNQLAQPISGMIAARKYSWWTGEPGRNTSNNLRGMIVNAKAHTVFKFTQKLGKVADAVTFAQNLLKISGEIQRSFNEFKEIEASNSAPDEKNARYSAAITGICARSLGQIATGTIDGLTLMMRVTKGANPVYWVDRLFGIDQFERSLNQMDRYMAEQRELYTKAYTADNIYYFLSTHLSLP